MRALPSRWIHFAIEGMGLFFLLLFTKKKVWSPLPLSHLLLPFHHEIMQQKDPQQMWLSQHYTSQPLEI
jgi:hypothetical protein